MLKYLILLITLVATACSTSSCHYGYGEAATNFYQSRRPMKQVQCPSYKRHMYQSKYRSYKIKKRS